ncbi:hypothetical protein Tco_0500542 [Tanacetum coccineum]
MEDHMKKILKMEHPPRREALRLHRSKNNRIAAKDSSTEATVDDMFVADSDMAEFNKPKCWAKLVRVLINEGSFPLLRILGTKSLAEMFTRERGYSQFDDVSSGYLISKVS